MRRRHHYELVSRQRETVALVGASQHSTVAFLIMSLKMDAWSITHEGSMMC
eukprot:CAMPEP_0172549830 /NCGR_PEP_ID=MMETSP1067-20121228/22022_1 /TAXON_ID=265564 ORGANISM="Thalassiosira punctigera, Strain Tpunct2005C2" /NCGR_SAMPLE_ID=MMETSP1067 /ASSEMBLY_ACC=CAM_ASM_000444 /LENGTH=50 /DNA_ID=CAMNT_0013337255 /DNA_START=30 /DNA_END=179 /DNA_ORIENTATION=+